MQDDDDIDAGDFVVVCGECGTEAVAGDCIDETGDHLECPDCGSTDMQG